MQSEESAAAVRSEPAIAWRQAATLLPIVVLLVIAVIARSLGELAHSVFQRAMRGAAWMLAFADQGTGEHARRDMRL